MSKLDKYDFNVYIIDGEIGLYAYRQRYGTHSITSRDKMTEERRELETDTANYTSVKFPMTIQYHEEISFLLENDNWLDGDVAQWEEYDDWIGAEDLTKEDCPAIIKSYLDHLPDYELEIVK